MNDTEEFYFDRWRVIGIFSFLSLTVFIVGFYPGPTTYFHYLHSPPGIYLAWVSAMICFGLLVWRLPMFFRSLFGLPAMKYDGSRLTVYAWRQECLSRTEILGTLIRSDPNGAVKVVSISGRELMLIDIRNIRNQAGLIDLLRRVSAGER